MGGTVFTGTSDWIVLAVGIVSTRFVHVVTVSAFGL